MKQRKPFIRAAVLAALVLASAAGAAEKEKKQPKITPPPPPESLKRGESVEPTVDIVERDWAVIREYRVGGQVYAVRIEPKVGFPYWLYDSNGDGRLETRLETGNDVPDTHQWRLLQW